MHHPRPKNSPRLTLVAAVAHHNHAIGLRGALPWHLAEDLQLFKRLTLGGCLLMGRRTWESLPAPLDGRINLVISRTLPAAAGAVICPDLPQALQLAEQSGRPTYVIGGAQLYRETLPLAERMVISWVEGEVAGDRFFPDFERSDWTIIWEEKHVGFTRIGYQRG